MRPLKVCPDLQCLFLSVAIVVQASVIATRPPSHREWYIPKWVHMPAVSSDSSTFPEEEEEEEMLDAMGYEAQVAR